MKPDLYERIVQNGASALSDAELYRVLLRTGSKQAPMSQIVAELLGTFPDFKGLNLIDAKQLMAISGIGLSKAAVIGGDRIWSPGGGTKYQALWRSVIR